MAQEDKWSTIDEIRKSYGLRTLVESGTFLGDTVEHFKDRFVQLHSIELQTDLYNAARQRFARDSNVTITFGDSGKVLRDLVPRIQSPALFWLDGHYSSEFFIGERYVKTARGNKDTPIEEELTTILASPVEHAILIDDARLFGIDKDYPSTGKIKKIVRTMKPHCGVRLMQDIIAILPKATH